MNIDKRKLTVHIIIGMIAGIVCGIALNEFGTEGWIDKWVVDGVLDVAGKIFLKLLTVLVVPLVFVSLVCGTAALNDIRRLGRVGLRTVLLYLGTTAAAISLAIVAAVVVQPGAGFDPSAAGEYVGREMPSLKETVIGLVPGNIVKSMAEGNMLPIIFFAVLFGMALVVSGEQGRRIGALFEDANEVIMNLVFMIMLTAPYGVFALVARTFANEGLAAILPLGKYFFLVIAVLVLHAAGTLTMLVRFGARVSPLRFFR
ncbi:MAG: dicarboxylate/amino acid:cation symporter, partial [Verrucomicrobia bacterium]